MEKTATFLNFYDEHDVGGKQLNIDKVMSKFQEQVENIGELFIEDYQDVSLKFAAPEETETDIYVEEITGDHKLSVLEAARTSSYFN